MMYKIYPLQRLLERDGGKCCKKNNDFGQKKNYMSDIGQIGVGLLTQYVSKREAG